MEDLFLLRLLRRFFRRFLRRHPKLVLSVLGIGIAYFVLATFSIRNNENPVIQIDALMPTQETNEVLEEGKSFAVHYIDVGQGDSSLIICDDHAMLIDAGDNRYEKTIVDYLNKSGIKHLDYVIGTHPDSDHIGGLDAVIKNIDCDKIYLTKQINDTKTYQDVLYSITKRGNTITIPTPGEKFMLGSAQITVIGPINEYDDSNNNSIVVKISYGNKNFLFTGDAEYEEEKDIIKFCKDNNISLAADVLKCGHHGSSSSTSDELLDAVNPNTAIISCGANNKYGHPHIETLAKLKLRNINIYRTDKQSTIIIYVENGELKFNQSSDDTSEININSDAINNVYIVNLSTKKFHKEICKFAEQISDKNKATSYDSKETLIEKGYDACGYCKP